MLDQEKERTAKKRLVRVDTLRSLAVSAIGLAIMGGGLYLLPSLSGAGQFKTWAYLSLGAVGFPLLRISRNAMALRPELDDEHLSDADRRLKPKLKLLLYTMGFAWFALVVAAIENYFNLLPEHTVPVAVTLAISYLATMLVGYIYRRKFVA